MDFSNLFYASVKPNRIINRELTPDFLLPNRYDYSALTHTPGTLHLLGGGSIYTELPFSFSFRQMDCHLLLYSIRGGGHFSYKGKSTTVTDGQIFFFDCRSDFTLQSLLLPWDFRLFFIGGADLPFYASAIGPAISSAFPVSAVSVIPRCMNRLLRLPSQIQDREQVEMNCMLTDILSELALSRLPEYSDQAALSRPLSEVWDYLEHHYTEPFSLEKLEVRFGINRYRMCREFSSAYGIPPQKYLTQKRLEEAKKMLLNTEFNVSEISSRVGYENVNHFINLFKKYVGLTPNAFRCRGQGPQSS